MNDKMLVFDMDGTIANLYGYPNWLESLRNKDDTPYKECEPLYDMNQLNSLLIKLKKKGYRIAVTSWLTYEELMDKTYKAQIRKAKREWLKRYNFPADEVHIVKYGTNKRKVTSKFKGEQILVDDSKEVREAFKGKTINAKENIIVELEKLL
jgi:5'(3')-deoxyribonucleotidase